MRCFRRSTVSCLVERALITPARKKSSHSSMPAPLVSLEGVSQRFVTRSGEGVTALSEVSLDIQRDQFVTVVGPSGCGKTTLMKLVGGLQAPFSGTVKLDGEVLARPSRKVGMVFQRPILLPWRSVLDNVLFPFEMLGEAPELADVDALLEHGVHLARQQQR
ncbi:MAG: ATP-binding cassette domain-containing protein, partial [Betaproteobacteria bacterium]|nr:ATP-binding cassette domain-containing protein [Betaproteobacteria bacterium]